VLEFADYKRKDLSHGLFHRLDVNLVFLSKLHSPIKCSQPRSRALESPDVNDAADVQTEGFLDLLLQIGQVSCRRLKKVTAVLRSIGSGASPQILHKIE